MSTQPLRDGVAGEVRAELARRRWTIQDLSDATGIPLSTLRRRISGASPFDLNEIELLAARFGVSPMALFPVPTPAAAHA